MHKKIKSLLVVGLLATNTIGATVSAFADTTSKTVNDTQIENRSTDGWLTTTTKKDLDKYWDYIDYKKIDSQEIIILLGYKAGKSHPKVEIPRQVDGIPVQLLGLSSQRYPNVTHIRVASGEGEKVKINMPNLNGAFSNSCIQYADFSGFDTTGLTSTNEMFKNCKNLEYVNLAGWDISNLTDMQNMFGNCPKLETLNFNRWKLKDNVKADGCIAYTPNLKNIKLRKANRRMIDVLRPLFAHTSKDLTLDVTNFDLSDTNTLASLFSSDAISKIKGLDTWDTSNIRYMGYMFANSKVKNLDLSNWNMQNVTHTNYMFENCTNLTNLNLSSQSTPKLSTMTNMFYNCSNLKSLDLGNLSTQKITNMSNLFYNCSSLKNLDLSKFDTENVTDMSKMFYNCSNLKKLDLSKFNTQNVTNMSGMFYNCNKLNELNVCYWDVRRVLDMNNMFYNCSSLKELKLYDWCLESVVDTSNMFLNCTSLKDIIGTQNWELYNVRKTTKMFFNTKLTKIDLSNANMEVLNGLVWSDLSQLPNVMFMFGKNGGGEVKVKTSDELLSVYDDTNDSVIDGKVTTIKAGPNVF